MKERIESLIEVIKSGNYDPEHTHGVYDKLLEEYILNLDPYIYPLIKELIRLPKDFWYA